MSCGREASGSGRRVPKSVRLAGAAIAMTLIASLVRRQVRVMAIRTEPHQRRTRRPESLALIINPRSGGGRAREFGVAAAAEALGARVLVAESGTGLAELAHRALAEGADSLGVAGGDGSLGVVAGIAATADVPFLCVPAGTRNHFALDVGLDRDDPLASLSALVDGEEIVVDLGMVGDRPFLNNVALGIYGSAVHREGYGHQAVQTTLEVARGSAGDDPVTPVRFLDPSGDTVEAAAVTIISNNPYVFAGPPDYGRRLRMDQGCLGVATVAQRVDEEDGAPVPRRWDVADLRLWSDEPIRAGVDGEPVTLDAEVDVAVRAGALRVLVPAGTRPGYAPAAEAVAGGVADLLGLSGLVPDEDSTSR